MNFLKKITNHIKDNRRYFQVVINTIFYMYLCVLIWKSFGIIEKVIKDVSSEKTGLLDKLIYSLILVMILTFILYLINSVIGGLEFKKVDKTDKVNRKRDSRK